MQRSIEDEDIRSELNSTIETSLSKGTGAGETLLPFGNALICYRLAIVS